MQLQAKLYLARLSLAQCTGGKSLAERVACNAGCQIAEVGVVQNIEEVRGETHVDLLGKIRLFVQLKIPVEDARIA